MKNIFIIAIIIALATVVPVAQANQYVGITVDTDKHGYVMRLKDSHGIRTKYGSTVPKIPFSFDVYDLPGIILIKVNIDGQVMQEKFVKRSIAGKY